MFRSFVGNITQFEPKLVQKVPTRGITFSFFENLLGMPLA